jgi:23S rRNA pseudouridine2605 synthase
MMHPSFHKTKVYEVQLDKPLAPLHQQMISDYGVQLEDGLSTFLVATIDQVAPAAANSAQKTYQITMHEGRNRQIRRTFAALGYTVTKLHRTQFGTYQLGSLQQAETRVLD